MNKPLTQVPSQRILIRCAELLHVPADNVYLAMIARTHIFGTFTAPDLFEGERDFHITARQYWDPACKIPFPEATEPLPEFAASGVPFMTTEAARRENEKAKRIFRALLAGLFLGMVVLCTGLLWAFLKYNKIIP